MLLMMPAFVIGTYAQDDDITVYPVPLTDEYITNPGIGWQHAPGIGDPLLPETVMYPQRGDISWRILNPERDVYEWSILDTLIDEADVQGKQISFRVYTMRGETFGGHQIPDYVLEAGAIINEGGEPDYSNCVYQAEWATFVDTLRERYDGNPTIAFIDISGYGNFNEWSWRDEQTEWDDAWWEAYDAGEATPADMTTLDSQARRRLADMFIGGRLEGHECRDAEGETQTVDYDYRGFQDTQLIMPYAGIRQSTQYVLTRRTDVGFRFDCLGRAETDVSIMEGLGAELDVIWRNAPVVYEICGYLEDDFETPLAELLRMTHASIVHDNLIEDEFRLPFSAEETMRYVGYRYVLTEATFSQTLSVDSEHLDILMRWQNVGYAPSYPRMGQDFQLHIYLVNERNRSIADYKVAEDVSAWLPADPIGDEPPAYEIGRSLNSDGLRRGTYQLEIAIVSQRTGLPINLAIAGRNNAGRYVIGTVTVE